MELKHLITQFTYRIEPNPAGGFVAHASDPNVAPLEAPTREDLQQKIQATIAAGLAAQFPGLKLPVQGRQLQFAFHIERKPEGGFLIQSADPNAKPIEGNTHEEIESHFAEKLIGFVGKHLMPELGQALAAQGGTGDIKVFVNQKGGLTINAGSVAAAGVAAALQSAGTRQTVPGQTEATPTVANIQKTSFENPTGVFDNSPITPRTSKSSTILSFLLTLLVIAVVMYFLAHRH
jgi:hypothetical protein